MASFKPNSGIPEHESKSSSFPQARKSNKYLVAYFPKMATALPASSSEFRKVLWTGLYSQVVIMTIPVGGDIGDEVHTVDQALTFTSGKGLATINGKDQAVEAGDLMVVPAGTQHQFVNTGDSPLVS
jgi:mannose-6-phosphate isomerase-like protein (cupin superfamily)